MRPTSFNQQTGNPFRSSLPDAHWYLDGVAESTTFIKKKIDEQSDRRWITEYLYAKMAHVAP